MQRSCESTQRMSRLCPACEYALTGLPEPCTCPECGREIEAGLRSIRVWPASGKPSWLAILVLSAIGLPIVIAAIQAILNQTMTYESALVGGFGSMFLIAALLELRKYIWLIRGKTTAMLHSSPSGVGMSENGKVVWQDWSEVKRLRYERSLFGTDWILTIEGFNPWYLGTRVLFRAVIKYSRRTAASVRNTLRRHEAKWQKRQLQERA